MSIKNFLKSEQNTIGKATIVIAFFTIFSRILGLVRDRLLASTFGPSVELDIYFASFKIPDLIYSIVLAGGVLVSLLPLFSDYLKKNKEDAWRLINSVINAFLIVLSVFALVFFIFTPQIVGLVLPGLDASYIDQAVNLMRLIFSAVFFLGLSSIFSTVLNYFNRFVAYSIAPVFYNICIILGIVFLAPSLGSMGPAIGVFVGSFVHFLIQFGGSLSYGYKYRFDFCLKDVKSFFKLLFPRIISASANQINLLVITALASTIAVGAISFFSLADNLRFLPVGFIGISYAVAIFPYLSKSVTDKDMGDFKVRLRKAFQNILYLALPISILTFLTRDLIVSIILKAGEFSEYAVSVTGACLGIFALSLVFQCLEPMILRAFYSMKEAKTPAIISLFFLIINFVLSLSFIEIIRNNPNLSNFIVDLFNLGSADCSLLIGLVIAYNISLFIDFVLLVIFLKKKIGPFCFRESFSFLFKIIISSIPFVVVALITMNFFQSDDFLSSLIEFVVVSMVSFIVYFFFTLSFKTEEAEILKNKLIGFLNRSN
ncbi:MAG: murein biosynthesis integral membrane protein MurJ [Candidatus Pacebacteria bacterium]|nr:murein biosynthesis integral membrane protein MurJ [Candidatus Paceibacterota bacterium]